MTKISVIVPVYNVEKYLQKCLDSLVNQTFDDFEVIVVNDGTLDNSQLIIDEYVKNYPKIIKSFIKKNGGLSSARNYGLKYASGKYIIYVDSDDWVDITCLEKMYLAASTNKSDIVVCRAYSVIKNKKSEMDTKFFNVEEDKQYILNRPSAWCKMIKKEILDNPELQFLENHHYEDISVMPALGLYAKKITFINDCLYFYLIREESIMHQKKYSTSLNDIFDSFENLIGIFNKKKVFNKYRDELEYLYIEHLLHAASLRFLPYEEGINSLNKINEIMKTMFPKWQKNKYYKTCPIKYKIVCFLLYKQKYNLVKKILK